MRNEDYCFSGSSTPVFFLFLLSMKFLAHSGSLNTSVFLSQV